MEPLSALSLAGNIVQFVEFSAKLVKKANEIKKSASGVTEELGDATTISQSLQSMLQGMQTPANPTSEHDKQLVVLAQNCSRLCQELQSHVQHIKGKGVLSKTGSLGVSWRILTESGKLASMEQRLDRYRSQILSYILFMMSHEQSATHSLVETLVNRQDAHARNLQEDLGNTRDYIVNAIRVGLEGRESGAASIRPQPLHDTDTAVPKASPLIPEPSTHEVPSSSNEQLDVHVQVLSGIRTALTKVADSTTAIQIVKWLWFPELESRERAITRAHENTYAWLLHDEQLNEDEECERYHGTRQQDEARRNARKSARAKQEKRDAMLSWLENGNGVFYISGKAGSGKSTLMKYLAQNPVTRERLNDWAGKAGKHLIFAEFFFWRPGVPLQKQIEGLYRGILWEILRNRPALTQKVFSDLWKSSSQAFEYRGEGRAPQLAELEAAFDILIRDPEVLSEHRVCLFIDRLDEYTGDYWKLSKLLSKWCDSEDIKICASGRPHNEFLRIFAASDEATWFTLHDLTRLDMLRFVHDELNKDERYTEAWQANPQYEDLIISIVDRADGVFLWVRLVVNDLLVAIGNSCSQAQLLHRLKETPRDLGALFRQMLNRVNKAEKTRLARTFLILQLDVRVHGKDSVYAQAVLDDLEDEPRLEQQLLDGSLGPYLSPDEGTAKCLQMGRRLIGRGQGLLEIVEKKYGEASIRHDVRFVHRTLADYLQEPEVASEIQSLAGEFNAKRSLARVILAFVKFWPREKTSESYRWSIYTPFAELIPLSTSTFCLIEELESLTRMLLKVERSEDEKDGTMFWRASFKPNQIIGHRLPKTRWADLGYALLCFVIAHDCSSELAEKSIRRFSGPLDNDRYSILIAAWLSAFSDMNENKLSAIRRLLEEPVSLNNEQSSDLVYILLPHKRTRAPMLPPGTPWTSILLILCLARQQWKDQDVEMMSCIELFLSKGADPSVYFVGYKLQTSNGPGTMRTGPFYADLPTMLSLWGLGVSQNLRSLLQNYSRFQRLTGGLSRLTHGRRLLRKQIQPLRVNQISDAEFQVLSVVSRRALNKVIIQDLEMASRLLVNDEAEIVISC